MEIKAKTPAYGMSLIKMMPGTNSTTNEPKLIENSDEQSISGNGLKVVYKGVDTKEAKIMLDVYDEWANKTGKPEEFEFSMRYYRSYAYMEDGAMMNSGAYAFHPIEGVLHPFPYGEVQNVTITSGNFTQEIRLTFGQVILNEKHLSMKSYVHITIDKELPLIKIDVDLDSLPMQDIMNGYEVVPNFHVKYFDNNKTFYTDSNGLEMQERILNYRPTYEYDLENNQPVSQNYYPINSAISMKDITSKRQFTVMNDRSQGGTSMLPGTIELMQNREAPSDDNKGVGEPLREKDEQGYGIRVKATYYVQICDGVKRLPVQRVVQQKVHDPANYFFNFNLTQSLDTPVIHDIISDAYKQAGVIDTVKVVHVPRYKNHIHLRL